MIKEIKKYGFLRGALTMQRFIALLFVSFFCIQGLSTVDKLYTPSLKQLVKHFYCLQYLDQELQKVDVSLLQPNPCQYRTLQGIYIEFDQKKPCRLWTPFGEMKFILSFNKDYQNVKKINWQITEIEKRDIDFCDYDAELPELLERASCVQQPFHGQLGFGQSFLELSEIYRLKRIGNKTLCYKKTDEKEKLLVNVKMPEERKSKDQKLYQQLVEYYINSGSK